MSGWCIVTDAGARTAYLYDSRPDARILMLRERAVRMVEADPRREAVVRAAVRWHARKISDDELLEAVDAYLQPAAVEKLQRKGRKP